MILSKCGGEIWFFSDSGDIFKMFEYFVENGQLSLLRYHDAIE